MMDACHPSTAGVGTARSEGSDPCGLCETLSQRSQNNGNNHSLLVVFSENKNKKILEIYKLLLCKYNWKCFIKARFRPIVPVKVGGSQVQEKDGREQGIKEEWNTEDVVLTGCLPNTYKALGLIRSKEKKSSNCRIAQWAFHTKILVLRVLAYAIG